MLIRRETATGGNGLRTIYRPCAINELLGNAKLKQLISNHLSNNTLPHTLLLSGQAGCGKTTVARVIALSLNCMESISDQPCLKCTNCVSILNQHNMDVVEINVGSKGGKADVDTIVSDLSSAPFNSTHKIIIFDEAHKLTPAAQDLLLKRMEDTMAHVYLIFCTNEPEKLQGKSKGGDPFLDRCDHMVFKPLLLDETCEALINISQFEGANYTDEVIEYIAELSKGVPRKAIGALNTVITEGSWDLQAVKVLLANELVGEDDESIIELSRAMIAKDYKTSIKLFALITKKYPVESVRVAVCGFFVGCLKRSNSISSGVPISKAVDYLITPIYVTGKPAEHIFYNIIFKVIKALSNK